MASIVHTLENFFSERSEVVMAFLFGSWADDRAQEHSDVDIAILDQTELSIDSILEIRSKIESLVHRDVDLVDLRKAHGALPSEVIARGRLILLRDRDAYAHLIKRKWYEHEDEGRFLQTTLRERAKQWQK